MGCHFFTFFSLCLWSLLLIFLQHTRREQCLIVKQTEYKVCDTRRERESGVRGEKKMKRHKFVDSMFCSDFFFHFWSTLSSHSFHFYRCRLFTCFQQRTCCCGAIYRYIYIYKHTEFSIVYFL